MRIRSFVIFVALFVAACGTTEKTVIVNPPPNSTVVVAPSGDATVVKHDNN